MSVSMVFFILGTSAGVFRPKRNKSVTFTATRAEYHDLLGPFAATHNLPLTSMSMAMAGPSRLCNKTVQPQQCQQGHEPRAAQPEAATCASGGPQDSRAKDKQARGLWTGLLGPWGHGHPQPQAAAGPAPAVQLASSVRPGPAAYPAVPFPDSTST